MNRSMPSSTIVPIIGYANVREAVAWLCSAFGFVERLRIGDHRAQLTFGGGDIVVTGLPESATKLHAGPEPGPSSAMATRSIMVRVADIDSHFKRATEAGAVVLGAPQGYPYGERQYTVVDIGGHVWTFSQSTADVDPASWGGEVLS